MNYKLNNSALMWKSSFCLLFKLDITKVQSGGDSASINNLNVIGEEVPVVCSSFPNFSSFGFQPIHKVIGILTVCGCPPVCHSSEQLRKDYFSIEILNVESFVGRVSAKSAVSWSRVGDGSLHDIDHVIRVAGVEGWVNMPFIKQTVVAAVLEGIGMARLGRVHFLAVMSSIWLSGINESNGSSVTVDLFAQNEAFSNFFCSSGQIRPGDVIHIESQHF
mmetsp:Transcript_1376/g.1819  ORF Transcript_1376/g.1819 Transcript_1376/m.1819 type:complete len:219 (-) Transcript_1376:286-942(-)